MANRTVTPIKLHPTAKNHSGQRFGRLTVVEFAGNRSWRCRCDCGKDTVAFVGNLMNGNTKSCGCIHLERSTTHGCNRVGLRTTEYKIWATMKARCGNPKALHFDKYGGRGIQVCERWKTFQNFLADMGQRPPGMSIERIDNNRGYSPDNCKWATQYEQTRNTSQNKHLTLNGETLCIADWVIRTGFTRAAINNRLGYGWTVERTLTEPIHKSFRRKSKK